MNLRIYAKTIGKKIEKIQKKAERVDKNMGVSVYYVEKDNHNSFSSNNFIDNGKNARPEAVKCEWSNNYWDNWIGNKINALDFLPYLVHFYPLNFDWNPASERYDIAS